MAAEPYPVSVSGQDLTSKNKRFLLPSHNCRSLEFKLKSCYTESYSQSKEPRDKKKKKNLSSSIIIFSWCSIVRP